MLRKAQMLSGKWLLGAGGAGCPDRSLGALLAALAAACNVLTCRQAFYLGNPVEPARTLWGQNQDLCFTS